jgi:hypothetical protein
MVVSRIPPASEGQRSKRSRTWRLRTAKDYAAFLQNQGRAREAFDVLKQACDSFTEGHDAPELTSARELLLRLGSPISTEL